MEKFWHKKFWSYYMSYFKLPKIILTMLLSVLFYGLIMAGSAYTSRGLSFYFLSLLLLIGFTIRSRSMRKDNFKQVRSKYLAIHSYAVTVQGYFTGSIILVGSSPNFFSGDQPLNLPQWAIMAAAIFLSFMVINHHALNYVFPKWLAQEVQERYVHLGDVGLQLATK